MLGEKIETVVRDLPGTLSVFAERAVGGNYLDLRSIGGLLRVMG